MGARGRPASRTLAWALAVALVVIGGSVASYLGARALARSDANSSRLSFHLASEEAVSALRQAIQHEEDLVVSASVFTGAHHFDAARPQVLARAFDEWTEQERALERYPELLDLGFVARVPAAALPAFIRAAETHPLPPRVPGEPVEVIPAGSRPSYCLVVAGTTRSLAVATPPGLDFCAIDYLGTSATTGRAAYGPVYVAGRKALGIETPVYAGGQVPPSASQRRSRFLGWLGELLVPNVLLAQAVQGHPGISLAFDYDTPASSVDFTQGARPPRAMVSATNLHNGWTVESFHPPISESIAGDTGATALLIAGMALSLTMGLLLVVLGTGRARALALVREKTGELSHLAMHDGLTGLPNRAMVLDRAEIMLARAGRRSDLLAGALFIDVDGFKHVNDTLGHPAGDHLLRTIAERLRSVVRDQDTVGRLGGDEFVVLAETEPNGNTLTVLADRITDVLRDPVALGDGRRITTVTASIGVAAGRYSEPDRLLRDADLALYAAKAAGKDRYVLFDSEMNAEIEERMDLERDLRAALNRGELFVLYQPIFDMPSQEIVAAEALVRWRHPQRGTVMPQEFIPVADESGLIVPIGRWVLGEACMQAARWRDEGLALAISVNVSARQLAHRDFAADVAGALAASAIPPSSLTLEITETTLMRDPAAARERLDAIRELGVRIAIDDFGTGYASISQLQRLPIDVLKIDRSFIAGLSDDGHGRELLEAIMGVGRALSLSVIAEGVEEDEQLTALEEIGCVRAQGFLRGDPRPAEEMLARARSAHPPNRA